MGQREKAAGVKCREIESEEEEEVEEEEEELVMGLGGLVMMMLKAQKRVISPDHNLPRLHPLGKLELQPISCGQPQAPRTVLHCY